MNLNSDKKYNQNEKEINRKGREKKPRIAVGNTNLD